MRFGLDYAWAHISPQAHKAIGSSFACRYLSNSSKDLGAAEYAELRRGGIDVVLVWETTSTRWEQGHAAGVADAEAARAEATRLGIPADEVIHFAVDYDEAPWQTPAMDEYFKGVGSVLGVHRTGVYGDFYVGERLLQAGLVSYFWQTYAWSGGNVSPSATLFQYSNGHTVAGVGVDYNHALKPDFGQVGFRAPAPAPHPAPAPAPHPAPAPAPAQKVARVSVELELGFDENSGRWEAVAPKLTPKPWNAPLS